MPHGGRDSATIPKFFTKYVDHTILSLLPTNQTSPKFSEGAEALRSRADEIRAVLNKARQLQTQQLVGEGRLWLLVKPTDTPRWSKATSTGSNWTNRSSWRQKSRIFSKIPVFPEMPPQEAQ